MSVSRIPSMSRFITLSLNASASAASSRRGVVVHNVGADGGRLALYRGAYSIQAYHVVQVQLQHEAAGHAGVLHDEAYLRQLADGLRHRSARNAKARPRSG